MIVFRDRDLCAIPIPESTYSIELDNEIYSNTDYHEITLYRYHGATPYLPTVSL